MKAYIFKYLCMLWALWNKTEVTLMRSIGLIQLVQIAVWSPLKVIFKWMLIKIWESENVWIKAVFSTLQLIHRLHHRKLQRPKTEKEVGIGLNAYMDIENHKCPWKLYRRHITSFIMQLAIILWLSEAKMNPSATTEECSQSAVVRFESCPPSQARNWVPF